MAADAPRPRWFLKIPPPIWTLAMLALAYAASLMPFAESTLWHSLPLAILFGTSGLALALWAVLTFLTEGTEIEPASASNKKLVVRGPFRITRNPMYLGLFLMSLGIAFFMGAWPFFAVPPLVFLLCHVLFIPYEEAKMTRLHGAPYTEYCARVRRWI